MEVWIGEQWKTIAESCIMGLIFGAGYDIIRIIQILCGILSSDAEHPGHVVTQHNKRAFWLFFAGDLIYMLFVTIATSIFLSIVNHGQLRLYLLLSGIVGIWLYRQTVGRLVMAVAESVTNALRWLVWHLLLFPLHWLFRQLVRGLRLCIGCTFGKLYQLVWTQVQLWRMHRLMRCFSDMVQLDNVRK